MISPRYLLDTNICIYRRRGRPISLVERFRSLAAGEAAISVITFGELAYGAEKSEAREPAFKGLRELLTLLPVLPLPVTAGQAYASTRAVLERRGELISSNDLWIAAHALAGGLILVTNNESEFRRVPRLTIENWALPK